MKNETATGIILILLGVAAAIVIHHLHNTSSKEIKSNFDGDGLQRHINFLKAYTNENIN